MTRGASSRPHSMTAAIAAIALLLPAAAWAWPCPKTAAVDGDGAADVLARSFHRLALRSGDRELAVPLPGPAVHRACLGDLDGDGRAELVVGVVRATARDPRFRQRLFVFAHDGAAELEARFLGTTGGGALVDFGLADLDGDGRAEVLARERGDGGGAQTRVYRWQGYGLVAVPELAARAPAAPEPQLATLRLAAPPAMAPLLGPAPAGSRRTPGRIRPLRLRADLAPAVNRRRFGYLPRAARRHLARHGFVVLRPAESPPEFHSLYVENRYRGLPSFVTADAALHLTHLLFDHALQEFEQDVLAPALKAWLDRVRRQAALLAPLLEVAASLAPRTDARLRPALGRIRLLLDTAAVLLGDALAHIPAGRRAPVAAEVARIEKAAPSGMGAGPLGLDYGDFELRGHYAVREPLARYFRAQLLLASVSFAEPAAIDLWLGLLAASRGGELLAWLDAFGAALVGPAAGNVSEPPPSAGRVKAEQDDAAIPPAEAPGTMLGLLRRAAARDDAPADWPTLLARSGSAAGGSPASVFCRTRPDHPGRCRLSLLARRWPADNEVLAAAVDADRRPFPDPLDLLAVLG